ncbi:hypothetical protein [Acinetobacter junii]|uniref:hypothetical protein n=1 Tax=Acinetobacter junii TaxID=40215 RepID=UPI00124F4E3A|nr:hypothetical protein [Acinetobacter junii]
MNAIKFIQDNGVEKAREVIEGAPYLNSEETHFCADVFVYTDGFDDDGYCQHCVDISELKRLVESVDIISKFDSVQEAKDAISNSPDGATDYRKLSCTIRYIKQSERFFEYWDGSIWCRPTVPFTEETHILRFTELSRLKQAIADYESIYGGEHV